MKTKRLIVLLLSIWHLSYCQRLHGIFVVDENNATFGPISTRNASFLETMLLEGSEVLNLKKKPNITELNPKSLNAKSFKLALSNVKVEKNDVVLFFYAGQPSSNLLSNFSHLSLNQSNVSIEDVLKILKAKAPRTVFLIADFLNQAATFTPIIQTPIAGSVSVSPDVQFSNLKKLLLDPCGQKVYASAAKNQKSFIGTINFEEAMFDQNGKFLASRVFDTWHDSELFFGFKRAFAQIFRSEIENLSFEKLFNSSSLLKSHPDNLQGQHFNQKFKFLDKPCAN